MCGGELTVDLGSTICECEYCGSKQTIPGNEAVAEFESLGTYKDCEEQILESKYLNALSADDTSAIRLFSEISGYKDANEQLTLRKLMNKSIKETYDDVGVKSR